MFLNIKNCISYISDLKYYFPILMTTTYFISHITDFKDCVSHKNDYEILCLHINDCEIFYFSYY